MPAIPNDAGLPIGAIWLVSPPRTHRGRALPTLSFAGPPVSDLALLPHLAEIHAAKPADIGTLARMLVQGDVLAVMRGRMEFGPRALGRRSLLAGPKDPRIKDALNDIKGREWWRPVAPMVTIEHFEKLLYTAGSVRQSAVHAVRAGAVFVGARYL